MVAKNTLPLSQDILNRGHSIRTSAETDSNSDSDSDSKPDSDSDSKPDSDSDSKPDSDSDSKSDEPIDSSSESESREVVERNMPSAFGFDVKTVFCD